MVRKLAVAVGLLGLVAACGAAPPRWYAGNETHWNIKLADSQSPELVVAATIHGKGPYFFLLAPEAPASFIDRGIAEELGLYQKRPSALDLGYVRVANQDDVTVPRRIYEVLALDVGELHIRNVQMVDAPAGTLRAGNRRIAGILGNDLLSRSIIVNVDRDAGVVRLALTGHSKPPENAVAIKGWIHDGAFYVPAQVGGRKVSLAVQLGRGTSAIQAKVLRKSGLPSFDRRTVNVDETGLAKTLVHGVVGPLNMAELTIDNVRFYQFEDQRLLLHVNYDGVLGQDVLSRYNVTVDRDKKILYLAPRYVGPRGALAER